MRFETPAAHRLGDGIMGLLWQGILPAALLIVFGVAGGLLNALKLPKPALPISLIVVGLLLGYVWIRTAARWLQSRPGWGMELFPDGLRAGARQVPYDEVRTLALTPLAVDKPRGDLGLLLGVGDRLSEARVVLDHANGRAAFAALRERCPGAVATDLDGVDHEPDDPALRAAALRVLGRRRVLQSVKHMVIGTLVLAWGGLLLVLVLFNDSKPLGDKLEAFLAGLSLVVGGGGYLTAAWLGWSRARANLAAVDAPAC